MARSIKQSSKIHIRKRHEVKVVTTLYPIAFNCAPLSSGRHCRITDLDKVNVLDRLDYFEARYRVAKIEPWSRGGYKVLGIVRNCLRADPDRRYARITDRVLGRYHTTIDEQLPALKLMEEAGMIQLLIDTDDQVIIANTVKPVTGPRAIPIETKVVTEDMRATAIAEGTIVEAETMIVFGNHAGRQFGEYAHFANTIPGDDGIYLTLDFVITSGPFVGQFVSKDFRIGTKGESPELDGDHPAFRQIANSALNLFPWDSSPDADVSRSMMSADVYGPFWNLQEHLVIIEVGKPDKDPGGNWVNRIVEPDHPSYLGAMDFGSGVKPGTGVFGDHIPPAPPPSRSDLRTRTNGEA